MASVQHLYGLSHNIAQKIIETHSDLSVEFKNHYFAAVKIQSRWRGFVTRRMVEKWNEAALKIQKAVRGWLVRWHLVDYYNVYYLRVQSRFYDQMASKIQATWKGYLTRKNLKVLDRVRYEKFIKEKNEEMMKKMRELFAEMNSKENKDKEAKNAVLFTLFKTHHVLRTNNREGIISLHDKKKLSPLEKLMNAIPMKNYMNNLKKNYYKEFENVNKGKCGYDKFTNKQLQAIFELYGQRDKSRDFKEVERKYEEDSIHKKPFILNKKTTMKKYEREMLCLEKYENIKKDILERTFDRSKNISKHDFNILVNQKFSPKLKKPPYYIDYLTQQKCPQHYIEYLFG